MQTGKVHECSAIAVADEKLGNAIKLFVVLNKDYVMINIDDEIRSAVKKQCGVYAVPREIEYRSSLPKTLVGKIDAKALS